MAAAVALAALTWAAIAAGRSDPTSRIVVDDARFPSAMAATSDGGFVYAERFSGAIRRVDPDGRLVEAPVATIPISSAGEQRGLLGVAVSPDGGVFASWTDPSERLMVGEVTGGKIRPIWSGPQSTDRATGGRIAFAPDGSIVVGIGDLLDPAASGDPASPNAKLLRLDPGGPPTQVPVTISPGWHNPFAFTFAPGGALWVADNAPVEEGERLARGDDPAGPTSVTELPPHGVPTGLAALDDDHLVLCTYLTRLLRLVTIGADGRARLTGPPLAADCALDVIVLDDGRVLYANETQILELLAPPAAAEGSATASI